MRVVLLSAVVVAAVVLWVEGFHRFAAWNLVPLMAVVAVTLWSSRMPRRANPAIAAASAVFSIVVLASVLLIHLAWRFDWGGIATGPSTSSLLFRFGPVYTLILGMFGAAFVIVGGRIARSTGRDA